MMLSNIHSTARRRALIVVTIVPMALACLVAATFGGFRFARESLANLLSSAAFFWRAGAVEPEPSCAECEFEEVKRVFAAWDDTHRSAPLDPSVTVSQAVELAFNAMDRRLESAHEALAEARAKLPDAAKVEAELACLERSMDLWLEGKGAHTYSMTMRVSIELLRNALLGGDRLNQVQVAGEYTPAIGAAGQTYMATFPSAHPLPARFRWSEIWDAMRAAAAVPKADLA